MTTGQLILLFLLGAFLGGALAVLPALIADTWRHTAADGDSWEPAPSTVGKRSAEWDAP